MRLTRVLSALAVCAVSLPALSYAQGPNRRWEVEGYGGIATAQRAEPGLIAVPPPGAAIVTSNPIFPGRQTSSWSFGDGAALLHGVSAEFGRSSRVTPLESVLTTIADSSVGVLGMRLRRRLQDGSAVEFGVDVLRKTDDGSGQLRDALDVVRASEKAALEDLLASGPFSGTNVVSTVTTQAAVRRSVDLTAALNYRLVTWGSFVPYATVGAGVVMNLGGLPSGTLETRYRFLIDDQVPVDETDRVSLHYARGTTAVFIVGGGVRHDVSARWGVRVDARVLVGSDQTRATLDAEPLLVRGTPSGFVESFTNPAVQFSNDPATGRRSTLSGEAMQGFPVLTGAHQRRGLVTAGVFVKF